MYLCQKKYYKTMGMTGFERPIRKIKENQTKLKIGHKKCRLQKSAKLAVISVFQYFYL